VSTLFKFFQLVVYALENKDTNGTK